MNFSLSWFRKNCRARQERRSDITGNERERLARCGRLPPNRRVVAPMALLAGLFDKRIPIMLQRAVTLSRYVVFVAVIAALAASVALILYEAAVVTEVIFSAIRQGGFQLQSGKALAVGLIEAIDVFLIAIVALVIGLGLHRLFVDEAMPLPRWLKIDDLEDLKGYLVSIVIAVLAVLFLGQAVERASDLDLLRLAAALALMIAALVFFLSMGIRRKE
jgi:uncharacterized membrane protein YqhA